MSEIKSVFKRNIYSKTYTPYYYSLKVGVVPQEDYINKKFIETKETDIMILSFKLNIGDKYKSECFDYEQVEIVDVSFENDKIVYTLKEKVIEDEYTKKTYNESLDVIEDFYKNWEIQRKKEKLTNEYNTKSWIYRKLHKLEDYLKENKEKWSQ